MVATISKAALTLSPLLLAACASTSTCCAPSTGSSSTRSGATAALGDGNVSSWVKVDAAGAPTAMGITVEARALAGLPTTPAVVVLPLPLANRSAFVTATVNWNPQGHPPAGIYTVPHFDFHFYDIDEATRLAIAPDAPGAQTTPAPSLVPPGYVADAGGVVPEMGLHYLPTFAPEFNGQPFTATAIYGYWNGRDDFVEQMMTRDFLLSRPSLDQALHVPATVTHAGLYPTRWHVAHDQAAGTSSIFLDGFREIGS